MLIIKDNIRIYGGIILLLWVCYKEYFVIVIDAWIFTNKGFDSAVANRIRHVIGNIEGRNIFLREGKGITNESGERGFSAHSKLYLGA
jgi:glutathionylspermidine synthase